MTREMIGMMIDNELFLASLILIDRSNGIFFRISICLCSFFAFRTNFLKICILKCESFILKIYLAFAKGKYHLPLLALYNLVELEKVTELFKNLFSLCLLENTLHLFPLPFVQNKLFSFLILILFRF